MSNPFGAEVKAVTEIKIRENIKNEFVIIEKMDMKIHIEEIGLYHVMVENGQVNREILIGYLIQMLNLGIGMAPILNIRHGDRLKRNMNLNPFRLRRVNQTFQRFLKVMLR